MRGIIFLGGEYTPGFVFRKDDRIICSDGGAAHAHAQGVMPEIIIGDLDSLSDELVDYYRDNGVPFQIYSKEKDYTDGELALHYALNLDGLSEIILLGALGGRFDQELGHVQLLYQAMIKQSVQVSIQNGRETVYAVNSVMQVTGLPGDTVSILPLENRSNVTAFGLQYPVDNLDINLGCVQGISNVLVGNQAEIRVNKGAVIVITTQTGGCNE